MPNAAVIVLPPGGRNAARLSVQVAGLSTLHRLILLAQRTGAEEIFLVGLPAGWLEGSRLQADRRLRATLRPLDRDTAGEGSDPLPTLRASLRTPFLLIAGDTLFNPALLRRLPDTLGRHEAAACYLDATGKPLDFLVLGTSALLETLGTRILDGGPSLREALAALQAKGALRGQPLLGGWSIRIEGPEDVAAATERLWESVGQPEDSVLMDRLVHRPLARRVTRRLLGTPLTPNQATLLNLALGLPAIWLFWSGRFWPSLLGMVFFFLWVVGDHVDGEIAQLKHLESPFGRVLDEICDQVIPLGVLAAIIHAVTPHLRRSETSLLGTLTVLGVLVSAVVLLRLEVAVAERDAGESPGIHPAWSLVMNRDLYYLLFVLYLGAILAGPAAIRGLAWLFAIGVNLHWIFLGALLWWGLGPVRETPRQPAAGWTATPRERRPGGWIQVLLAAAGLAILAGLLYELGGAALPRLLRVRWGVGPILLLSLAILYIDTLAWQRTFPGSRPRVRDLLGPRLAGEALNDLIPSGYMAGEPVKVALLARRGIASEEGAASVVISRTTSVVAEVLFALLGIGLLVPRAGWGNWMVASAALGSLFLGGLLALFVVGQQQGLFSALLAACRWFPLGRSLVGRLTAWAENLDQTLAAFYRHRRRDILWSLVLFFAGWVAGGLEVWLVLALVDTPVTLASAVAIEALSAVIRWASFVVPAALGTQEGGFILLLAVFGVPPDAGLTFALVRRLRQLFWAAIGLGALFRSGLAGWWGREANRLLATGSASPIE